jgi:hypothetical protein
MGNSTQPAASEALGGSREEVSMEGRAAGQTSVPGVNFFGHQLCPQCLNSLVAPDASQHISEQTIKHIWFCEACGTEFATLVKLRRRDHPDRSVAAA